MSLLDRRGWGWGAIAGAAVSCLLILMARKVIDHGPLYDELLHVLSARGLLAHGEPMIADGLYTRASLFTHLVAISMGHFGDTLVAARLPSLIATLALILLTAIWVTGRVSLLAGVFAAGILIVLPATLELAVFVRFYVLHGLVIGVMAIALYEAATPGRSLLYRALLIALALILVALGWHLQPTTVIAVGALLLGVASLWVFDNWPRVAPVVRRYPVPLGIAAIVIIAGGLALLHVPAIAAFSGEVPLWAAWAAHMPYFYVTQLARSMPFLWPMFPLIIVLAVITQRRFAIFCAVVVLSALAVHSVAAAKSVRYIYYLFPFIAALWGCALAGIFSYARAHSRERGAWAVLILTVVTLGMSTEGARAAKLMAGRATPEEALSYAVEAEWSPIVPVLKPLLPKADRIVTSNAMKALYYLGRYDFELNASIVPETDTAEDFGIDQRTGRKAIGEPASVAKILDMPGLTLVVLETESLNLPHSVSSEALAVIEARCAVVLLPTAVEVRAWRCQHSD
jgi:hypothetical protein